MTLLEQLKDARSVARAAGDEILTRAATEGREPSPEELAEYQAHVVAAREAADRLEAERDRQLAEVRAMATRGRAPTLTREAAETARQFRSAIFAKNRPRSRSTPPSWPTSGPTTSLSRSWAAPAGSVSTPGTP